MTTIRHDQDRNARQYLRWLSRGGKERHLWEHGELAPLRCQRCGKQSSQCCMAGDPRYQAARRGRYGVGVREYQAENVLTMRARRS